MSNLYLKNMSSKNWDLIMACCVETLRSGSFTWKTVDTVPMRLKRLMDNGIICRVPDTRDPYEYVAPAATLEWYREHIDGDD